MSFSRIFCPRAPSRSFLVLLVSTLNVSGEKEKYITRKFMLIKETHPKQVYLSVISSHAASQTLHKRIIRTQLYYSKLYKKGQ